MTGLACATKDAWAARHKITIKPAEQNDWYAQLGGFESLVVAALGPSHTPGDVVSLSDKA